MEQKDWITTVRTKSNTLRDDCVVDDCLHGPAHVGNVEYFEEESRRLDDNAGSHEIQADSGRVVDQTVDFDTGEVGGQRESVVESNEESGHVRG